MHLQRTISITAVFKDRKNLENMYKNVIKLQNVCDPFMNMFVLK